MRVLTAVSFACLAFAGCSDKGLPEPDSPVTKKISGMNPIQSRGHSFFQGIAGSTSSGQGFTGMVSRFSYNFQIDSTEVTQGSFRQMMGRDAVPAASPFGVGDDFPVYNVSWFDAVLYCNARSKDLGLDTVYTYTRTAQGSGGNAYEITGLTTHLDKEGIRLPTEAEWEYAARAGMSSEFAWGELKDSAMAKEFAWSKETANGMAHPVATLKANRYGLYDMAGNVTEWVNDWKGAYLATEAEDFAGARDPGVESDVPVKGGSFKYGLLELRPANRSATYASIRSATAEYVGFRCVYGAIKNPSFFTADGSLATTDAVTLDITQLQNLVEGRPAKLVFVNASANLRHLVYVDYRRNPPRLREFNDVANVFYPVISPDGNWVAFGTSVEGTVAATALYCRRLDDTSGASSRMLGQGNIPRWWVNPASLDTFLVYTSSAMDDAQGQWTSTRTLVQKMSGGEAVGSPEALVDGAFHDGRSTDGRWLATGFRFLKIHDADSGLTRTLFTAPGNGKPEEDTSQVCNVSIAPDSSGRTLMLDFGYNGNSAITGSFYDIHQIAFMLDPYGKVLRWFKAPREEKGWEDLEWSNQIDFAVSAATDAADHHRHLYLLNLKDSSDTRIASGTLLSTPGLWLGGKPQDLPTEGLSLDSLGYYNDPSFDSNREVFAHKMHLFWTVYKDMQAAFLGSSQVNDGVDPALITSVESYNLSYSGGDIRGTDFIVRNYILPNCPNINLVGISIPYGWFRFPGADGTWSNSIAGSKGIAYDQNHGFWKSGLPLGLPEQAARVPFPDIGLSALGQWGFTSEGWGGPILEEYSGADWSVSGETYIQNLALFERLIADLSERKIHCLFFVMPQSPVYKTMHSFSFHGPDWGTAKAIAADLIALQGKYPYFHFLDFNLDGNHDYVDADAFDSMHLSWAGSQKFSSRLNLEIEKILHPPPNR